MNSHLLRFKKHKKYLVFDYETCGLNLSSLDNKPWQLAFIVFDNGEIKEKVDYYLKWDDLKISDGAKKVTGFKEKVYKSRAIDPLKALDHFEKYFYDKDYLIVGHNIIGFDIYIHNIHRLLCGKKTDYSYLNRLVDTNCLAKADALNIEFNEDNILLWQMKLQKIRKKGIKTNLKSLCQKYDIKFDESKLHDALYDIEQNLKVFQSMLWKINI